MLTLGNTKAEIINLTHDGASQLKQDSISNEFVISQAEMGPISVMDYRKLRGVP